jgi:hypothetical protein
VAHFYLQSPGSAFIFVTNLAPPAVPFKVYHAGSPTVWTRSPQVFTYQNAPTITSLKPNWVRCERKPILISPGTNYTHLCDSIEIDVNGCGYDLQIASYCSFFGNSTLSGNRIQNAPYTLGKANTNQQIRCSSPTGTDELRRDCAQFQNATFPIGPRNFGIAQLTSTSPSPRVCALDANWFPLAADTQVKFTFYDNPAFLNFTRIATPSFPLKLESPLTFESSSTLLLEFLRVSDSVPGFFFVVLLIFFHTHFYAHFFS